MTNDQASMSGKPAPVVVLWAILLAYGLGVAAAAVYQAEQTDPDGISYIRLAGYLTEGHVGRSVTGHWSPLLSWLIAPLLMIGLPGLHAGRVVLALGGGFVVWMVWMFGGRLGLRPLPRSLATMTAAVMAVGWTTEVITPDVILTGLLLAYLTVISKPDLLRRRATAIAVGALGGLAFLTKAYALPFFLVHFPLTLWLRSGETAETERPRFGRRFRAALLPWAVGMAGCIVVSGVWIATLSVKYGRFTVTTVGGHAHRYFAPPQAGFRPKHMWNHLIIPADYAMTKWEDPDTSDFPPTWSPFASGANLRHAARRVFANLRVFCLELSATPFALAPLALLAVAILFRRNWFGSSFQARWLLLTVVIYVVGYLGFHVVRRFFQPVMLIDVLLVFLLFGRLMQKSHPPPSSAPSADRALSRWRWALVLALSLSPLVWASGQLAWGLPRFPRAGRMCAALAKELRPLELPGPVASTLWHRGLFLAYHLDSKFLGIPFIQQEPEVFRELADAQVGTFLIWDKPALVSAFERSVRWQLRARFERTKQPELDRNLAVFVTATPGP